MQVENAVPSISNLLHDVGAGSHGMPNIDTEPESRIHVFDKLERIAGTRKVFVFGTMIVNRDLDIVFLNKLLDSFQIGGGGSDDQQGNPGIFCILEKHPHMLVGILSDIVIASAHNFQAGLLKFRHTLIQFLLRKIIGQVMGFDVNVWCSKLICNGDCLCSAQHAK